ncbi:beta-N-acetylglucosaminidase domain-containing protein [Virgibacillus litoralis]|uniref:Hyaluronoglucosaminidase n=1 Tax=Virgibacillus litoralis TaxID=578221 RepID=A0ABS4HDA1_9BACI|nr:beta-N-acetylglucosaminidase domain-containing protein [Virgibacillus litoralis]MBP1948422.1 hyaluronoglucosaminidase [Virgibacillus litoralis]
MSRKFLGVFSIVLSVLVVASLFLPSNQMQEVYAENGTNPVINPSPQEVKSSGNGFPLTPKVGIVVGEGTDASAVNEVVKTLNEADVEQIIKKSDSEPAPNTPVTIWIGGPSENNASEPVLKKLGVEGPEELKNEGYVLVSGDNSNKQIVLSGKDKAGTFYAAKTFKQLVTSREGRDWVTSVEIRDWPEMPLRGVIEGFYGKPWSQKERLSQIDFYSENKMNTYVYAPKDDMYHRDKWREPYPEEKLSQIGELVNAADEKHVNFIFTISPGLDICYSSEKDFEKLTEKAQAMWDLGVRDFAILLDDIFQEMNCEKDVEKFGSSSSPFASAQAYLLNKFQKEFIETHKGANRLITVPTEYYQDGTSPYKKKFAELVDPDILVYWTGIGITTDTITNEDAEKMSNIFKHELLVWDNFPVNDFARDRLFLGPLTGRDAELTEHGVNGLTANPMEHSEASKIPLFTVADYTWNSDDYNPAKSWEQSIHSFGGDYKKQLQTFSENALSSPLNQNESPTLSPLIDSFWQAYNTETIGDEGNALLEEFKKFKDVPKILEENFNNKVFLEEVNPWLDKMEYYGITGSIATNMLLAQQKGDKEKAQVYRENLNEAMDNDLTDITIPERRTASRSLDGINKPRGSAELVMYTSEYGETTGTNQWGYEITVVDGKVIAVGGNDTVIPDNGFVLSVHSAGDGQWLEHNSLVGSKVSIDDSIATLITEEGVYHIPNEKTYAYGVTEPFINKAIQLNDNWLGSREHEGPFSTIDHYSSYVLENMNDGNLDTLYWTKGAPKQGDYIGIDLGEVKKIDTIELYMASTSGSVPRPEDYIYHGEIQISTNGSNWEELGEYEDQPEISINLTEGKEARFIRFKVQTDQTGWAQIREFIVE